MSRLKEYKLTGATDISSWDSSLWENSGLIWDGSNWVAMASGGGTGASNLSELTIDDNKDWDSKGIYNMAYLSSATISGGTILVNSLEIYADMISGLTQPTYNSGAANKIYVDTISGALDTKIDALGSFDPTDYMTSSNIISNYIKSTQALSNFYPSDLGVGVSSNLKLVNDWYEASSAKLSASSQTAMYEIIQADDISSWDSSNWENSGLIWDGSNWVAWKSGSSDLDSLTDTNLTSPASGEILVYKQNDAKWENELPPLVFSTPTVRLLSGQNLNLCRMKCPTGKKAYLWQCGIANSGGISVSGLQIQFLSGNTQDGTWSSIYKTSSTISQGYPLGVSDIDSNIEIRAMYSGTHTYGSQGSQLEYCTAFAQVSIY